MQLLFILHSLGRPVRLASPAFTRRGIVQRAARYFSQRLIMRGRRKRIRAAHERTLAAAHSITASPFIFGADPHRFGFAKEF